jgi:hypothetical protein
LQLGISTLHPVTLAIVSARRERPDLLQITHVINTAASSTKPCTYYAPKVF